MYLNGFDNKQSCMDVSDSDINCGKVIIYADEWVLHNTFQKDPKLGCELLFRRYYVNMCSHAIRFVYSKEIAEDIVSDIFANFWQKRIFEQINTSYRAYLYKTVRHRSYNYIKWELNRTRSLDTEDQFKVCETMSPDATLQFSELHHRIETIIQQLPPQCRRAYQLKKIEGKKYTEIAIELQISTKAVEALVSRGISKLRNELRHEWFLGLFICFHMHL